MPRTDSTTSKFLLKPLSKIYGMVTSARNRMFEWGVLKQHATDIPVITVGNLAVGGTGKTPHTECLVSELSADYNIGVLSRGYKRHTKGYVEATPQSKPQDIGDEAYQMYHKFGRKIPVAVCENRVVGIKRMRESFPELNLIILDDGFQHRYVKPTISILLTEYSNPYYADEMLPYGYLREGAKGAERADIVIVTKCPDNITPLEFRIMEKNLGLIPAQTLLFSRFKYERLRPIFGQAKAPSLPDLTPDDSILAVSGIANPRPFVKFLKAFPAKVKVNVFSDHHEFTRKDFALIEQRFNKMTGNRKYIVTTEKDAVRLLNNPYFPSKLKNHIFYQPIRVDFVRDGSNASLRDDLLKRLSASV